MFIPIIVAATRPNSNGMKVGKAIHKLFTATYPEIETVLVSPNDFEIKYDDDSDPKFTELTAKANAFIFIISEYNHGYPGRFKSLIDSEFDNYSGKYALFAGVSDGVFGGARAIENFLPVLRAINMRATKRDIIFREAQNLVTQDGRFTTEDQKQRAIEAFKFFLDSIDKL